MTFYTTLARHFHPPRYSLPFSLSSMRRVSAGRAPQSPVQLRAFASASGVGASNFELITLDATGTLMTPRISVGEQYRNILAATLDPAKGPEIVERVRALDEATVTDGFMRAYKKNSERSPCFGALDGEGCVKWWRRTVWDTYMEVGVEPQVLETPAKGRGSELKTVFDKAFDVLYWEVFTGKEGWSLLPDTMEALRKL
eukprot:Cvel_31328.t1-p1 / transcript=Cvel_31328.t1 / gene=Cvel_31328 / organism=Chromera_velia_CCMP2878 / gene_product=hypothetical protein / transcript_product=hypothetical protein / location=Cvel_scaffold4650:7190-8141(+) / protein_length=198 / sequence_SO=supercontig / SO=protein_coding / is_pseudo=false